MSGQLSKLVKTCLKTRPRIYNISRDSLHEDDGGHEVCDEAGEGDDALHDALDPEREDLDQVVPAPPVLAKQKATLTLQQF